MTHDERLGPPALEPLSDAAWSRIERGVWSELDAGVAERPAPPPRPARRWWLAGGALAAAAAIVAIVLGLRTDPGPLAVVDEPSRVVSGTGPSAVSFGDAHIAMDAETALVLTREAGHPVVLIERGAAWFTVAPRDRRPAFIVRAGDASVHVVGTRFRVARSEEQILVAVEHGVVDVRFRGAVTAVGARQRWSSTSPAHATQIASATDLALPAATGAASPAPTRASVPGPDPAVVADPAVAPDPAPARTAAPDQVRSHRPRPPSAPTARPAPAAPAEAAPPAPPALRRDAARGEYDRLAALEPVHPEAALDGYLALARGTGSWAEPALFAAARLAADRGDRRAVALLERYLQRAPAGANAADARRLLARLKGTPQ